jgi:hypothetical protein
MEVKMFGPRENQTKTPEMLRQDHDDHLHDAEFFGRTLGCPICYPGEVERCEAVRAGKKCSRAIAERHITKHHPHMHKVEEKQRKYPLIQDELPEVGDLNAGINKVIREHPGFVEEDWASLNSLPLEHPLKRIQGYAHAIFSHTDKLEHAMRYADDPFPQIRRVRAQLRSVVAPGIEKEALRALEFYNDKTTANQKESDEDAWEGSYLHKPREPVDYHSTTCDCPQCKVAQQRGKIERFLDAVEDNKPAYRARPVPQEDLPTGIVGNYADYLCPECGQMVRALAENIEPHEPLPPCPACSVKEYEMSVPVNSELFDLTAAVDLLQVMLHDVTTPEEAVIWATKRMQKAADVYLSTPRVAPRDCIDPQGAPGTSL